MKINPIFALIAFAISALAGYGFYTLSGGMLMAIGGGLTIFLPLGGLLALSSGGHGSIGNIRALSVVFLVVEIIVNIIFSLVDATTAYIITNGILILVYFLIGYAVSRALK
ncbi:MAG: hypothetical protein LBC52_01180 [Treponema sp.]|jgi:hypothetical protein|nr:hypothetical protein [Treponema sp.]